MVTRQGGGGQWGFIKGHFVVSCPIAIRLPLGVRSSADPTCCVFKQPCFQLNPGSERYTVSSPNARVASYTAQQAYNPRPVPGGRLTCCRHTDPCLPSPPQTLGTKSAASRTAQHSNLCPTRLIVFFLA